MSRDATRAGRSPAPRPGPYLSMFGAGWRTATAYPVALVAAAGSVALSLALQLALWSAVFDARAGAATGGYSAPELSTYLVAANLLAVLLANQSDERLGGEVYRGDHVVGMVRPVGYLAGHAALGLAHVLVRLSMVAVPLAVASALLLDLRVPGPAGVALFLPSAALATALGLAFNLMVGMAGFVTTNTWGTRYLASTVTMFLSGQLVPLALLPAGARHVVEALPFAAMVSMPVRLLLGRYDGVAGALALLGAQAGWLLLLAAGCRVAWSAATRYGTVVGG
jgi:ABC-2 type transport system permease protein